MALTPNRDVKASTGEVAVALPSADFRQTARVRRGSQTWKQIKHSWQLYVMLALPVLWLVIFAYIPIFGAQIAFRDFNAAAGITGSPWVGLKYFDRFIHS